MQVCHMQSNCKTVTGMAFLGLVSRNNKSLKKFNLFSFPFPVYAVKCRNKQPGLQARAEADRG